MKICPLCNTTYEDWIDFCFADGMPLTAQAGAASPLPVQPAAVTPVVVPKLAEGADLPEAVSAPEAPAGPVGAGDVAERAAPVAPPSDITGIFTGGVLDDDGEAFLRPPPKRSATLAEPVAAPPRAVDDLPVARVLSSAPVAAASVAAAPVPEPAVEDSLADEATSLDAGAPAQEPASSDSDALDQEWAALGASGAAPAEPEPESEPEAPAPRSGGGLGMIVGGLGVAAVVVIAVVAGGVMFMGKSTSEPAAPVEAPAPAAPVAAVPPPPEPAAAAAPPVEPVAEVAPVPAAPLPAPAAPPVVAPPPAAPPPAATPVAAKPAPAPVPTPAPAKPTAAPTPAARPAPTASSDANPWGAPAAVTSGSLKVITDPDGATVYINDQQRGKTPLTVDLPYGAYNIRVVKSGFKTEVRDVNIRVAELSVPFNLRAEVVTGQLNVYGPTGYRVFIDGYDRGAMPLTVQVSEGVRQFRLVNDADGSGCTVPKDIKFRTPGRPETLTLSCP